MTKVLYTSITSCRHPTQYFAVSQSKVPRFDLMSSITSGITTSPQNRFLYSCVSKGKLIAMALTSNNYRYRNSSIVGRVITIEKEIKKRNKEIIQKMKQKRLRVITFQGVILEKSPTTIILER